MAGKTRRVELLPPAIERLRLRSADVGMPAWRGPFCGDAHALQLKPVSGTLQSLVCYRFISLGELP